VVQGTLGVDFHAILAVSVAKGLSVIRRGDSQRDPAKLLDPSVSILNQRRCPPRTHWAFLMSHNSAR
jgi:hypothetical protein